MMNLRLRLLEAAGIPGGRGYILCDDGGVPLPGQRAISVEQRRNEATIVTVELVVDGTRIRLDPNVDRPPGAGGREGGK
jgi:hypothetical protein